MRRAKRKKKQITCGFLRLVFQEVTVLLHIDIDTTYNEAYVQFVIKKDPEMSPFIEKRKKTISITRSEAECENRKK